MGDRTKPFDFKAEEEVLNEVKEERLRQHNKWGQQDWPDGTGSLGQQLAGERCKCECEEAFAKQRGTWEHILTEEYAEAMAESDPSRLEEELIQVSAVCCAWVMAIRRKKKENPA